MAGRARFWIEVTSIVIGVNLVLALYPNNYVLWAVAFLVVVLMIAWTHRRQNPRDGNLEP